MNVSIRLKYNKFDKVYHITPNSNDLIILDARIYMDGSVQYLVTSGIDNYVWINEEELTKEKIIQL